MELKFTVKAFNELSITELYQILSLRNEVFIVEQQCPYLDIDGKDTKAHHVIGYDGDNIAVYARVLPQGVSYEEVSIGRVITANNYRGLGLGKKLMEASFGVCNAKFQGVPIRIGAQHYLLAFYESLGFKQIGDPYDEDGILHVDMIRKG
ncbi:MAG: GNAT family N-acetyltransferase [Chitinophagaceae bacterium]|nr:MAG: GNAT family N-acetyltransferase [Chitinophagaceae bacterium]